jgi:hypothetical protein
MAAKGVDPSTVTFAENWVIYRLYVRQEYDECLSKIEGQLKLCNGLCEYAVFVKGESSKHAWVRDSLLCQRGSVTQEWCWCA